MKAVLGAALMGAIAMSGAQSAELKIVSANGLRAVLADLKSKYETTSGHTLAITVVETGEIRRRIAAGEPFDVIIVPVNTSDEMAKQNQIVAGSAVPVARTSFGLAVRADAPKPDASSADALKRSLLAAKSILITDPSTGGISGVHFMSVVEKLGIADELKPKLNLNRGSGYHAERIVKGEADLAIQAEHEIKCIAGAAFVPYPAEFQRSIVFTASVGALSKDAAAARGFIQFLAGPDAAAAVRSKCLQPG